MAKRHTQAEEKKGKEIACHVNWQDHFLWQQIATAQQWVQSWSPQEILTKLYRLNPKTFEPAKGKKSGLHCGTLVKWIDQKEQRWKDDVLTRVEAGG